MIVVVDSSHSPAKRWTEPSVGLDSVPRGLPAASSPSNRPNLSGPAGQAQSRAVARELVSVTSSLGRQMRDERHRRGLTMRGLSEASGVGRSTIADLEGGAPASLETYLSLAHALRLRPEFGFVDARRRSMAGATADIVHAAMGEAQAAHLRGLGYEVGLDEPYQHFQFAGRADVVAWTAEPAALLHIENKTRLDDVQATFGAFNAKRRYLGTELATAHGVERWRSETHVLALLWSREVADAVRRARASFAAVCSDAALAFEQWWSGEPPGEGRRSILVSFDPLSGRRSDRRRWAGLAETDSVRPRYRDYADAAAAVRRGRGS
jgi:transcriptional regulator with XRE-family HTH domain